MPLRQWKVLLDDQIRLFCDKKFLCLFLKTKATIRGFSADVQRNVAICTTSRFDLWVIL